MKKHILLLVLGVTSLFAVAQSIPAAQVSSSLRDSLKSRFPNAQNVEWTRVGSGFKASFSPTAKRSTEVSYDQSGNWQKISTTVSEPCSGNPGCGGNFLLDSLRLKIQPQLSGYTQKSVTTVQTRGKGTHVSYVLDKAGKESRMEFDERGKVIMGN